MPSPVAELVDIPNVELIRTGSWAISSGQWNVDAADLVAAVVALNCPAIRKPRLKVGHVDPRFNASTDGLPQDGEPAIGWVDNLRTADNGQTLVGDYRGVPSWLGGVMASAYPDRSVEGYHSYRCQLNHTHPFVLTGVALLGVTPPGVGTLRSLSDVAELYGVAASDVPRGAVAVAATIPGEPVAAAADENELKRYWLYGPGLRKWADHDHPWRALYDHIKKFVGPERAKRIASAWYREHFGHMPNQKHKVAAATDPDVEENAVPSPQPSRADQIREAWNRTAPESRWIVEVGDDEVIVTDDTDRTLHRVPMRVTDDGVTFGQPVPVRMAYVPTDELVAASRTVFASRAESRPDVFGDDEDDFDDLDEPDVMAHMPGKHNQGAHGNRFETPGDRSSGIRSHGKTRGKSEDGAASEGDSGDSGEGRSSDGRGETAGKTSAKRLPDAQHNALESVAARDKELSGTGRAPNTRDLGLRDATVNALQDKGYVETTWLTSGGRSVHLTDKGHEYLAGTRGDKRHDDLNAKIGDLSKRADRARKDASDMNTSLAQRNAARQEAQALEAEAKRLRSERDRHAGGGKAKVAASESYDPAAAVADTEPPNDPTHTPSQGTGTTPDPAPVPVPIPPGPTGPVEPAAEPEPTNTQEGDDVSLSEFRSALGLDDTADEAAVLAAFKERLAKTPPTQPDSEPDPQQPVEPAPTNPTQPADDRELVAAAAKQQEQFAAAIGQIKTLSEELAAVKAEKAAERKAAFFAAAVAQGKVAPADRESWEQRYDKAPDLVAEIIGAMAVGTAVPVAASGYTGSTEAVDISDEELTKAFFSPEQIARFESQEA